MGCLTKIEYKIITSKQSDNISLEKREFEIQKESRNKEQVGKKKKIKKKTLGKFVGVERIRSGIS